MSSNHLRTFGVRSIGEAVTFILVTTLACPFSLAQDAGTCEPETIKRKAIAELEELRAERIDAIDGKNLAFIEETIEGTTIIVVPRVSQQSQLPGATRETARWDAKTKTIWVSEDHCRYVDADSHRNVLLHEFFGIAGVRDNNFGKTAGISNLRVFRIIQRSRPDLISHPELAVSIKRQITKIALGGGGVTGVEGGGDVRVEAYAYMLYKKALNLMLKGDISGDLYELLCQTLDYFNIEFSAELKQGELKIDVGRLTLVVPDDPMGTMGASEHERSNRARIDQLFDDILSGRLLRSLQQSNRP